MTPPVRPFQPSDAAAASSSPRSSLHGLILICSRAPETVDNLRMVLQQAGADTAESSHEEACLSGSMPDLPDLLLMDVSDADGNEPDFIRRIKEADQTRYVPILVLCGSELGPEACLDAGADDFLNHPIQFTELILRARLLMRLGRLHQDLADNNTELQAAYETARESEAKYRALIQEAQDAIYLIDPATKEITESNRRSRELSGYSGDELRGQPISMLGKGDSAKIWSDSMARVVQEGRADIPDALLLCKNGEEIPIEIHASLANHHLGEPLIQVHCRDIRSRQMLDIERAKSERLAAVVETAVTVNHEINNPLLVITASVDSLQQSLNSSDSAIREKLDRIDEACKRIQRFTQKLTSVIAPVTKEFLPGMKMLDIEHSVNETKEEAV